MEKRFMKQTGLIILLISLLSVGCEKEKIQHDFKNRVNGTEKGTIQINMTDGPANYAALFVQFSAIEVYSENSGWTALNFIPQTVDILSLRNGKEITLALQDNIEAGIYLKMRITFGQEHRLVFHSEIQVPGLGASLYAYPELADNQRQLTFDINKPVKPGSKTKILLDFDAALSVKTYADGSYILQPVIREVLNPETKIKGDIDGAHGAAVTIKNSAYQSGAYTDSEGNFLLTGVPPGSYTLHIDYSVDNNGILEEKTMDVQGILVQKESMKDLGVIQAQ